MRLTHLIIIGLALQTSLTTEVSIATDVIGQVYALHRYATEPFADERAKVVLQGKGRSIEGNTGSGGTFYLYDVPPGTYELRIESHYGRVQRRVRIGQQPRQDLGRTVVSP